MRGETVAANYAATLFELAERRDALEEYGEALATVAALVDSNPSFRIFLETPRIPDADRKRVIRAAFGSSLPRQVVNFVLVVIDRGRQRLIRSMSLAYQGLLDDRLGREHVEVTLAREADDETLGLLVERLTGILGREAIPHVRVRPEIMGGVVVRTRDAIYDGSVLGRIKRLRLVLLDARLGRGRGGDGKTAHAT